MRRVCVVVGIAALFLLAPFGASTAQAEIAAVRGHGATVASIPVSAAEQLFTVVPTSPLRSSASDVFAVVPAAILMLGAPAVADSMRRRGTAGERLDCSTVRMRGPPKRRGHLIVVP